MSLLEWGCLEVLEGEAERSMRYRGSVALITLLRVFRGAMETAQIIYDIILLTMW